jgi:hypothetical protein
LAKKFRGKLHYFGRWEDPNAALTKYLEERDDLNAGRVPRQQNGGVSVRDVRNQFLTSKQHLLEGGELSPRLLRDYLRSCNRLVKDFGRDRPVSGLLAQGFCKTAGTISSRPRMFEAFESRQIITAADATLKAMVLLGINLA